MSTFASFFAGTSQQPQQIFAELSFVSPASAQVFSMAASEFRPFRTFGRSPPLVT
jgi:hypothetical protein